LHEAGKKVIGTNRLLADRLNRVLARQDANGYHRAKELIGEIKTLALRAIDAPPETDEFLSIGGRPSISFPFARPLSFPPQNTPFVPMETFTDKEILSEATAELFTQFAIDVNLLHKRIEAALSHVREHGGAQVSLGTILQDYPAEKGLAEIMAYFSIASRYDSAVIRQDTHEVIEYNQGESLVRLTIPKVLFS
jgi:hypothetical protein